MASPKPVPPVSRERLESRRKNRSNTRSRISGGMPGPSSSTAMYARAGASAEEPAPPSPEAAASPPASACADREGATCGAIVTRTMPPSLLYLMALLTRLYIICSAKDSSPCTVTGAPKCCWISTARSSAAGARRAHTRRATAERSTGSKGASTRSSRRESVSTSSIKPRIDWASRRISPAKRGTSDASTIPLSISSA